MSESSKGVLLIVDDEPLKRMTLQIELSEAGYSVTEVPEALAALKHLNTHPVDVVITDLRMPGMDGLQFLEMVNSQWPKTHVILMTAFGSVDSAVEAIKRGAYDYITKPFATELLLEKLDKLRAGRSFGDGAKAPGLERLGSLVGRSYASRRLFEQIQALADNECPVLIAGEIGTGKKLVAEAVHQHSRRSQHSMIKLNCAAFGRETLEAELFGTNVGVSTGTTTHKASRLGLANGGTFFLDEVDTLPLDIQIRLLPVLEEKTLDCARRGQSIPIDIRLICATRKDLRRLVNSGKFREDLYYRLNAVNLTIPPLRDRREDIAVLAEEFLKEYAAQTGVKPVPTQIKPHALDMLMKYHWPGNISELKHVIERAITLADGGEIQPKDIMLPAEPAPEAKDLELSHETAVGLSETIAGVERTMINAALRRAAGNQAKAAQFLGIPRTTLRDKMAKYGMFGEVDKRQTAQ